MEYRRKKKKTGKEYINKTHKDQKANRPTITIDYEKYAHFLEDSDLTEEQKQEFLQTIWNIIIGFVDLGFGVHPVEQAQGQCGQLPENLSISALTALDGVKYSDRLLKDEFEDAGERETDPAGEFAE